MKNSHSKQPFKYDKETAGIFSASSKALPIARIMVNGKYNGALFSCAPDLLAELKLCAIKLKKEGYHTEFTENLIKRAEAR